MWSRRASQRARTADGDHLHEQWLGSGNGTISCASCHVDADVDGLAWDFGNPGGDLDTVFGMNLTAWDMALQPRTVHPMKGPMLTQTLRALGRQWLRLEKALSC